MTARTGQADRAARCLRRIAIAGLAGGLAMIPVGIIPRSVFGQSVNVYGELIVIRVAGRLDPLLLAIEHGAVSLASDSLEGRVRRLER